MNNPGAFVCYFSPRDNLFPIYPTKATEAELALVGLGGRKTPSEVSYPTSYTASGDREAFVNDSD